MAHYSTGLAHDLRMLLRCWCVQCSCAHREAVVRGRTSVDNCVYSNYAGFMSATTTIRISRDTHSRVTRLAAERNETIDQVVSEAIRALKQDAMARDLAADLDDDEVAWLNADAG